MALRNRQRTSRLSLIPLSDVVHFPRTELQLHVVEPEYQALVEELFLSDATECRVGTVLLKPAWVRQDEGDLDVFSAGTACSLIGLDARSDGCDILLRGEFRFEVEHEITDGLFREAVIRPVAEPVLSELDPGIQVVRSELIEFTADLAEELGDRFPFGVEQLHELGGDLCFEELVNRLAADLDLTPLRKLQLLSDSLPDRALHLLSILRSRRKVLDVLRPYRHLARSSDLN